MPQCIPNAQTLPAREISNMKIESRTQGPQPCSLLVRPRRSSASRHSSAREWGLGWALSWRERQPRATRYTHARLPAGAIPHCQKSIVRDVLGGGDGGSHSPVENECTGSEATDAGRFAKAHVAAVLLPGCAYGPKGVRLGRCHDVGVTTESRDACQHQRWWS